MNIYSEDKKIREEAEHKQKKAEVSLKGSTKIRLLPLDYICISLLPIMTVMLLLAR